MARDWPGREGGAQSGAGLHRPRPSTARLVPGGGGLHRAHAKATPLHAPIGPRRGGARMPYGTALPAGARTRIAVAMAGGARGSARTLLAALLALLGALLVAPARGRGGRGHGDWGGPAKMPPLPPREDAARVARFVAHVCDWGALATISTEAAVRGRPFADVLSLSDGPPGAGRGVPYLYLSPLQQSAGHLQVSAGPGARGSPLPPAVWRPSHAFSRLRDLGKSGTGRGFGVFFFSPSF